MFNFENEFKDFKKKNKVKKLTEQIFGKLINCVSECTLRDRIVDTTQLDKCIRTDSQLNKYHAERSISCDGRFIYLPSYTELESYLLQQV